MIKEIAFRLNFHKRTIESRKAEIFKKLSVRNDVCLINKLMLEKE